MPPIREYQKARADEYADDIATPIEDIAVGSEKYVCPSWSYHCRPANPAPISTAAIIDATLGEMTREHQEEVDVLAPREDTSVRSENTISESEKYTCPPWSYHCRPDNPAHIDTKILEDGTAEIQEDAEVVSRSEDIAPVPENAAVSTAEDYDTALVPENAAVSTAEDYDTALVPENAAVSTAEDYDTAPVPENAAVSTAEEYVCPPWSYHCRPVHPAPETVDAPSVNPAEKVSVDNAIIDKRSHLNPSKAIVPSTASLGFDAAVAGFKGARSEIEPLCILSKDPSGAGFVEKCEPFPLDGDADDFPLIKRGGDDDLAPETQKQHSPKSIPESKCFLTSRPGSDETWVSCPSDEYAKRQSAIMGTIAYGKGSNTGRFSPCDISRYGNLEIILLVVVLGLGITVLASLLIPWRTVHSKRSNKAKASKSARQTSPVHFELAKDSSDCYMGKTDLCPPGKCLVLERC